MSIYDIPERSLEPPEVAMPVCPECGEETSYIYRDIGTNKIVGCEHCIEKADAYEEREEHEERR